MLFFLVKPEVAGGLGDRTEMDSNTHPPRVDSLHYAFDGWSGDILLTSFPCFIVTLEARMAIEEKQFTGVSFEVVEVTKSATFEEFHPDLVLPEFSWLRVNGIAGKDDFGIANNRLIVSDRTLKLLKLLGLNEAVISTFED